nr:hypothetical protein [uncultured Flavobacterium sp.]
MVGFDDLLVIEGNGKLKTIDNHNNECEFLYRYGKVKNEFYNLEGICFQVYSSVNSPLKSFQAYLINYLDGYKVVMINHNDHKEYMKKGIPEYLIPEIAKILGKNIYSSATIHKSYLDEDRVPNATKFWERIRKKFPENVTKNHDGGYYIFLNDKIISS